MRREERGDGRQGSGWHARQPIRAGHARPQAYRSSGQSVQTHGTKESRGYSQPKRPGQPPAHAGRGQLTRRNSNETAGPTEPPRPRWRSRAREQVQSGCSHGQVGTRGRNRPTRRSSTVSIDTTRSRRVRPLVTTTRTRTRATIATLPPVQGGWHHGRKGGQYNGLGGGLTWPLDIVTRNR